MLTLPSSVDVCDFLTYGPNQTCKGAELSRHFCTNVCRSDDTALSSLYMAYRSQVAPHVNDKAQFHQPTRTPWASYNVVSRRCWCKAGVLVMCVFVMAYCTDVGHDFQRRLLQHTNPAVMRRLSVSTEQVHRRVSRVCVHNRADIMLQWHLISARSKFISVAYPINQTRCIHGSQLHASWNAQLRCIYRDGGLKPCHGPSYRYSGFSRLQANYECIGIASQVICNSTGVSDM